MTLMKKNTQAFPALANIFEEFFKDDADFYKRATTLPSVNIKEKNKEYVIELAAPGYKKEDFDIDLEENILTISTEHKEERTEENENFTKREFYYNEFKRSFALPETADTDNIKAEYKNGVLKLKIAKKPEAQTKPKRKISIK